LLLAVVVENVSTTSPLKFFGITCIGNGITGARPGQAGSGGGRVEACQTIPCDNPLDASGVAG